MMSEDSVLPEGWRQQFLERADLEHSFQELRDSRHFYAEAMRGRIRSLQLSFAEANRHFEKAAVLGRRAPDSIVNAVRQFLLHIFLSENLLSEGPFTPDAPYPEAWLPELDEELTEAFPEVKLIFNLRRGIEGMLRVHECRLPARFLRVRDYTKAERSLPA